MRDVVIVGTGGHAKVISDIIKLNGDNVVGYLTSDKDKHNFLGRPILGTDKDFKNFSEFDFIIAIGNQYIRENMVKTMDGIQWYSAIHPNAIISSLNVTIGEGTVVGANAVINPYTTIGRHCIINTNASIEHDNIISDFSHISVGACLGGNVAVGKMSWVGMGATIRNGIHICDDCVIGCGAVVVKDILSPGTYIGLPAKELKKTET